MQVTITVMCAWERERVQRKSSDTMCYVVIAFAGVIFSPWR